MATLKFSGPLQLKRGTKADLLNSNYIPAEGEPIVEFDTGQMKIGNGSDLYKDLCYVGQNSS